MQFIKLLLPLSKIIFTFCFCVCLIVVCFGGLLPDSAPQSSVAVPSSGPGCLHHWLNTWVWVRQGWFFHLLLPVFVPLLLFLLFLLLFLPHHLLLLLYKKPCGWREGWNTDSAIKSTCSLSCREPRFSSQCPRDASDLHGQHTHTYTVRIQNTGKTLIHKIFFFLEKSKLMLDIPGSRALQRNSSVASSHTQHPSLVAFHEHTSTPVNRCWGFPQKIIGGPWFRRPFISSVRFFFLPPVFFFRTLKYSFSLWHLCQHVLNVSVFFFDI